MNKYSEFQTLCEKYGLSVNCTAQAISHLQRKYAHLHPDYKSGENKEGGESSPFTFAEVTRDCVLLAAYLPVRDQYGAQQQKQTEQAARTSHTEPVQAQPQSTPPQTETSNGFRRSDWQKEQTQKRKQQAQLMQQRLREQEQRREHERELFRAQQEREHLAKEQEKRRKEQEAQQAQERFRLAQEKAEREAQDDLPPLLRTVG